jgi:anti-sigma B factor antagonist
MAFDSKYLESFNAEKKDLVLTGNSVDEITLVIVTDGILDTYNSPDALKAILETMKSDVSKNIVLDLEHLNYISSTGVGALVELLKTSTNLDKSLFILNMETKVKDVMNLLGFLGMFNLVANMDEVKTLEKSAVFPVTMKCPSCGTKLRVPKAGRFKCSNCKKVIEVNKDGKLVI